MIWTRCPLKEPLMCHHHLIVQKAIQEKAPGVNQTMWRGMYPPGQAWTAHGVHATEPKSKWSWELTCTDWVVSPVIKQSDILLSVSGSLMSDSFSEAAWHHAYRSFQCVIIFGPFLMRTPPCPFHRVRCHIFNITSKEITRWQRGWYEGRSVITIFWFTGLQETRRCCLIDFTSVEPHWSWRAFGYKASIHHHVVFKLPWFPAWFPAMRPKLGLDQCLVVSRMVLATPSSQTWKQGVYGQTPDVGFHNFVEYCHS